ncbi:MAG: hypothetical protein ABIQ95_03730 [Bdellovibrionia bacterium]
MNLIITLLIFTATGLSPNALAVVGGPLMNRPTGVDSGIAPFAVDFSGETHPHVPSLNEEEKAEEISEEDLEIATSVSTVNHPSPEPAESSAVPPTAPGPIPMGTNQSPSNTPVNTAFDTRLTAEGVKLSRSNRLAGFGENEDLKSNSFFPRLWERMKFKNWDGAAGFSRKISCVDFAGTHAGNKVYFKAEGRGGSGRYIHSLIYTLNASFDSPEASGKQYEMSRKGNGKFSLKLPPLRDDVSYVQLTVLLLTRDLENPRLVARRDLTFLVARPVILSVSNSLEAKQKECYQRFLPYPSTMGILSNGSANPSKIEIQQATQNSWSRINGWQVGVFFSPFSFLTVGNLFFFNLSYFQQTTKKIVETVAVSTDFRLDPGEFMQIYTQPTRYITPYDATLVEACGETRKVDGAYMFQWWGYSYIPFPIKLNQHELPMIENIGAPAVNTCPEELTPKVGDQAMGSYEFRSTM